MSKKRPPRPRIQRAFVHWFNENRSRFKVPIRLTKVTAKGIELHFYTYPDCLSVWLLRGELNVNVEWRGQWWDMLISLDAYPRHTSEGYVCALVEHFCVLDQFPSFFPSREALWLDHLFAPFLQWVNEKLALARWLKLSMIGDGGATWAQLIQTEMQLSKPDRTLMLMQQLKRIDGQPCFTDGPEDVATWMITLQPECK